MTGTAVARVEKAPLIAGGQVAAIIPGSIEEIFRIAEAFQVSGLAPQSLNSREKILVAIMAGAEVGFAPYQAMQSMAVINNRASLWGDALPALLWSKGFQLDEWFDDEDNATKAFCKITRPSGKQIERTYSLKDAKLANLIGKQGPWQTAQKRMLQMRARAFCARDGASDVLKGLPIYEEVQDFQQFNNSAPAVRSDVRQRLEARGSAPAEGFNASQGAREAEFSDVSDAIDAALDGDQISAHDAETGEVIERDQSTTRAGAEANNPAPEGGDFPGDRPPAPKPTITERVAAFERRMSEATNPTKLQSIRRAADQLFDDMERSDPEGRVELAFKYEERMADLEKSEAQ